MTIENYLAKGGVLTSPENVPSRYRGELMRLMATFVDSELAGAAGFADLINSAPGLTERIVAARIVLEKNEHAGQVLTIMEEFGVDTSRYVTRHPWTARISRNSNIGATRTDSDMRLAVFNYPIKNWDDAVVMNVLMGFAVSIQMSEFVKISYQPLAEQFRIIAAREEHHTKLAVDGLKQLLLDTKKLNSIQDSINYWWPRVGESFGKLDSQRTKKLISYDLRQNSNSTLKKQWIAKTSNLLKKHGLKVPKTT